MKIGQNQSKKYFKLNIREEFDEKLIKGMSRRKFKKFITQKVRKAAFDHLIKLKNSPSKIKHINYKKLEVQPYILSEKSNQRRSELSVCSEVKNDEN